MGGLESNGAPRGALNPEPQDQPSPLGLQRPYGAGWQEGRWCGFPTAARNSPHLSAFAIQAPRISGIGPLMFAAMAALNDEATLGICLMIGLPTNPRC